MRGESIIFIATLLCGLCGFSRAELDPQVVVNYETVVETFQGELLVDTYSLRGSKEIPVEIVFDEDSGEFLEKETELHLLVTFTRYSDTFVTVCVVLSVFILVSFIISECQEIQDGDVEDDDLIELDSDDLRGPLLAKA